MANWKYLFQPWILDRGQEYCECGQVVELEKDGSLIRAQVSGSQLYRVELQRSGEYVVRMSCDCPYAAGGENCKHMAAVLFALEDTPRETRMDWQAALDQMPEKQLRELLRSLAEGDGSLQDRIVRMVSGPGDDPMQWQDDLGQIISKYADRRGWLDYDRAYDCMADLAEYLEESLPYMLIDGRVMDAAKLMMTVYGAAFGQDMDDSDGGLSLVSEACRKAMDQILQAADSEQERMIFDMLHELMGSSQWSYGTDDLEEWILNTNWAPALLQKNLQWLDDHMDSWRMSQRADLMTRMGASTAEVIAWWEQYRENDSAYHPLLALYEEYDLPKAIELVRENRTQETIGWRMIDETKTLLRLLEKAGEQVQYEKELRYLVLELRCQETEYLSRLKSCTPPEQWIGMFAAMLADAKRPTERMHLYHFEGTYDLLFKELAQYPHFGSFHGYEQSLRAWNPERSLELYIEVLKREMDRACDRKEYRRVVGYLHELGAYPGGQDAARKLADYWYIHHKNRPAMKDELRQAGYPQK